ncbi:pyruvoyl-dependent arginine decarboxylase [Methanohalophilus sp. WG1-DM]|jgi:arginine decarboxylase|uniref:pyruvoyl-dependent arginine decarboxylase n=1 Tax=Methanohalophilus sp. WG1-DM TaxID=2491675 RepID=UPI000FFF36FC|nr:arginine decarboxylase, pyruvoyl-dependent [Methanohalophilus sp. WG1-DM]RXG34312.1 arginine decarboxylase [Methanohalophilus sp. WG1-DM]
MIPSRAFLTKGTGIHRDKLASFELALRDAGIEKYNLVSVSSILPPGCRIIPKEEGLESLRPGEIVYSVLARNQTNEAHRLVASAVGMAVPVNEDNYGYISEHHSFGEDEDTAGMYAEDIAATMLATTLGIEFDADSAWQEREQLYRASGHIINTSHFCQTAKGDKSGLWTTVVAAMVFVE